MKSSSNSPTATRHLSWTEFQERILEGIPFVHRIPSPAAARGAVDLSISENGEELAIWLPCEPSAKISIPPLRDIEISVISKASQHGIEIRSRTRLLFQEIYNFFVSIVDKVHLEFAAPEIAVMETVERWRELLRSQMLMSLESQLGLYGELWLLKQLAMKFGELALDAWTGPHRQAHDFRIGNAEFEVKATRSDTHTHFINGLNQMEPSLGKNLYLLSLRFGLAGAHAGSTLSDEIRVISDIFSRHASIRFFRILKECYGYDSSHELSYGIRWQLADLPRLVSVIDKCPRLTRPMLSEIPLMGRIGDVRYRANFEGLGIDQNDPMFNAILLPSTI